ncbi:MAG: methylmalonyl-CoA mutase family protein [Pseudomonadales bacterium]|jgi:methylmalonyl-CoA mutase|nr:methylmalonyl-CoA mutase family protein [Pseudomonadales bacterium]
MHDPFTRSAAPLRFVTAASLFDGHDAAINLMRRLIQAHGAEVIHLGHNRGVREIVRAALQEDADGIAVSSYQGGHMEFFRYMVEMLRENGAAHIRVFGGGGGTITSEEIAELQALGVERIYHPRDGMELGLPGMIDDLIRRTEAGRRPPVDPQAIGIDDEIAVARMVSSIESGAFDADELARLRETWRARGARAPVVGVTGTGGAGKSSVTDELLARFLRHFPQLRIAVLAVDPTRRRTGGALLGDRIRMNSLDSSRIYMRSMATRRQHLATSEMLGDVALFLQSLGFDLVLIETAGIGQSDSEIVDLVDLSVYVMTSEYGAASQLEKIDMIDFADLIVLNKFDRRGAEDALRDVRKQWRRNHQAFTLPEEQVPVFATIASQFNDPGMNWVFHELCTRIARKLELDPTEWTPAIDITLREPKAVALIPAARTRYLAEIAEQGRELNARTGTQAELADRAQHLYQALSELADPLLPAPLAAYAPQALTAADADNSLRVLRQRYQATLEELDADSLELLRGWPERRAGIRTPQYSYTVRGSDIRGDNYRESLSRLQIPKIGAPDHASWGGLLAFLRQENLPGYYPYTAGVFPYRREGEDPTRMFAGEGTPERTNRRFHFVARGQPANRLSTAFDSVTLYGEDPQSRPDVYGKIGNSGVSIATVDDLKKLYSGFDLCDPRTSVSMTINGPAPMILAFYMNAAIDQQVEKHLRQSGQWEAAQAKIDALFAGAARPRYDGALPEGNDGLGLGLLGISGEQFVDAETYAMIRRRTLESVRGTVQADILKEDQAQNTCIFSTGFALTMMGDVQEFFIASAVKNYYSVSISGYHIAEAGANPVSQLAFTLANGFTIVEYYLARGMAIDDFAPNLSFFFSNGMDPEYTVIGRVARRIWARAMKERYGASARSQMLKYHVQTSGRSLHAQEMSFNDIRTTLQALYALFDNCNSLHTNAYDEAITTPTEESVRRAVAIQLIINRELGLNFCENPWQGSFIVEELTDLVEAAVYQEFDRLSERGGVLGAMDTMYQRSKIQDESQYYESRKHDGSLPLIGVNTFLPPPGQEEKIEGRALMRSSDEEKRQQIDNLAAFHARHAAEAPAALARLQEVAIRRGNLFAELMQTVKVASLGQISQALYEVGGVYRRNM